MSPRQVDCRGKLLWRRGRGRHRRRNEKWSAGEDAILAMDAARRRPAAELVPLMPWRSVRAIRERRRMLAVTG